MNIFRKIKTSAKVFSGYGIKEAFGLIHDNFRNIFAALKNKLSLKIDKISMKLTAKKKGSITRILFVTTEFENNHSQTVRYRIRNVREALKGKANTKLAVIGEGADFQKETLRWADIIIIMRAPFSDEISELSNNAKDLNIPLVFDIDDIVFLPEYAPLLCRAFGDTTNAAIAREREKFIKYQKTFELCDYATASTPFIAEKMDEAGKRAFLIHNGLNKTQLKIAKKSNRTKNIGSSVRAIGYLSGTKTHDRDFEQALGAITRILKEYPDVVLRVAGYLDVSIFPKELSKTVITAPYMSWQRLMHYGASNYINIAPLDIENPFCHAKSELKYFEAAAVGVPTIASTTDTFKKAIENTKTGMLCSTEEEWYKALKKLLDDRSFYNSVSKEAHDSALRNYSPEEISSEAINAYMNILKDYRTAKKG